MMLKSVLVALGSLAVLAEAAPQRNRNGNNNNNNAGNNDAATGNNNAASTTCLSANALQTGSFSTGQVNDVAADGQANSATDKANFINFCSGETLTNGLQVKTGSCNGIVMGKIPATTNMVSTVITSPKLNDNLDAETTFNVVASIDNLNLGTFTNATSTYYSAPQDLSGGNVIGHTHITIQDVGSSFQFSSPLDASQFVFFKGINDAGDGQGTVTTAVTGGLPAGNYRVCTMSSSANHQPVIMPVAQRGAQDDCRYFSVGSTSNSDSNSNSNSDSNTASSTSAAAATTTSSATSSTSTGSRTGKGKGGRSRSSSSSSSSSSASSASASSSASSSSSSSSASASSSSSSSSDALGGIAAPAVTDSGNSARPFAVNGDTFVNKAAAVQRACSIQNNACASAVNAGTLSGVTVADCNEQQQTCDA